MDKTYKDMYQSKDLGLAALLVTKGCTLEKIEWKDNIAYFIFRDPSSSSLAHDYQFGNLQVNPRSYYAELRRLRYELFSMKENKRPRSLNRSK